MRPLIVVPDNAKRSAALHELLEQIAESPRAVLLLTDAGVPVQPCEHPPSLPVTFDDGEDARDLALRLHALISMRPSLTSLHHDALSSRRTGEHVARQYKHQLQLASRLQRKFLPEQLPAIPGVDIDTAFCPAEYVSGDIYDVHRLDEDHVGIALADATGHGMPAALLTVYVKRALRGKEVHDDAYEILAPDVVLRRLNDEIVDRQPFRLPIPRRGLRRTESPHTRADAGPWRRTVSADSPRGRHNRSHRVTRPGRGRHARSRV